VKRPFFLVIFAMLLAGLVLFGLSDIVLPITDTGVPDNEATTSQIGATNSSASATITITWTTASPSDE